MTHCYLKQKDKYTSKVADKTTAIQYYALLVLQSKLYSAHGALTRVRLSGSSREESWAFQLTSLSPSRLGFCSLTFWCVCGGESWHSVLVRPQLRAAPMEQEGRLGTQVTSQDALWLGTALEPCTNIPLVNNIVFQSPLQEPGQSHPGVHRAGKVT